MIKFFLVFFVFVISFALLRLHERVDLESNTFNTFIQSDSLLCNKTFYLVTDKDYNLSTQLQLYGSKDTFLIKNNTFPDIHGKHSILMQLCDKKYVKICSFTKTEHWKKYHVYITLEINKNEVIGYQEIKNYIDDVFASKRYIKGLRANIIFKENFAP